MNKINALKGMNDLLPAESPLWQYLESTIAKIFARYGFQEIRFPIMEQTGLFKRSIGEVTDIVEKEMYTFADRNEQSVTLRPEGTASCVRACEQHQLLYNRGTLIQKLWYSGPMFRHENPQKGRLRQFHQFGVEAFGMPGPDIDAEILAMTWRLWRELGIDSKVTLQINSLGEPESRAEYREALKGFLQENFDQLDKDSQARVERNPLRVLDSKDQNTQKLLESAPKLVDYLDQESKQHFDELKGLLEALEVPYIVNPNLVRGLDYYSKTVFEWVTDALGAQGTICAGGRYDGLVAQLGGKATPAVGFGMGVERLVLLVQACNSVPESAQARVDIYIVAVGDVTADAMRLAESVREQRKDLKVQVHCGGGNFKNQMKKADKSGANIALILGENEAKAQQVAIKYLREGSEQKTVAQAELTQHLD